jgi:Putative beta-barrel porin 2
MEEAKVPRVRIAAAALCILGFALPAWAQQSEDPVDSARYQFGPLGVTPTIALTNLGVDSNVFNTEFDPKSDFTFTTTPRVQSWFRAGRTRWFADTRADLNYFQKYSTERSADITVHGRFEVPLNRMTPWAGGGFSNARQRVGYEIDVRTRRRIEDYGLGVDVRAAPKTTVGLRAQRQTFKFSSRDTFLGTSLREALARTINSAGLQYRQRLTPLTTFVLEADAIREEFDYATERDADGVRVLAGFDLSTFALISGKARVGFRKLDGIGGGLPPFRGVIASVGVATTLIGRTRMEFTGSRDVEYSIETIYPYYVRTGGLLTLTPRLTKVWDVQGRLGAQRLAYRVLVDDPVRDRTDRYVLYGGGIGYRLGRTTRLGFYVDRENRQSNLAGRSYKSYRIGTSVTYGT